MKAKKILSAVTALTLLPTAGALTGFIPAAAAENSTVTVRLDPSDASPFNNGEFEGWGTSLCWWANRLGYSEKLTQAAAEAFFSDEGLSLDIARYNIGGGDDPTHNHVTRSDSKVPGVWETFEYTNDGADVDITAYDVTNDQNQLNIALAAKAANPDIYFEGFSNSPPYFMTNSGCSSGAADAGSNNLRDDMYDDFAEYIAESTQLLKDNGIVFESYSPMNEPDTNYWGANSNKQEGCHYDPGTSQSKMIVETRKALDEAGLDDVLVAGMDETSIDTSVNNLDQLTDEATDALGRIDTHTYSGSRRTQLKAKAQEMNKDLWMSEVDGGWDGFGLADRIILDMNGMMPSAWVMWDIIDVHKDSDFRDPSGNATEANNSVNYTSSLWGVGMADHDNEELVLTGKYYMFGQFTKYIEPGDTIIASSDSTLAAYNKDTGDIKIVVSNSSGNDIDYSFDLGAFSTVGTDVTEIRSNRDGSEQWATITGEASLTNKVLDTTAKAGTVTTYVVDGTGAANYGVISGAADSLELNATVDLTLETDLTGDVEWSVSDPAVAEITADGALTTKALGTVTVSATVAGKTFSRTFNVPFTGTINGVGRELRVGSTAQLSLTANISGDVAWSVSDTGIAMITPEGLITGVTPGEVTIYASIGEHTLEKTIRVQLYTVTGTPSWDDDGSARPDDGTDYLKATDGDFDTYFDGVSNGWVQYDYGAPFKVTSVKLAARSGNGMADRMIGGTVRASNDGITWTDLYKVTTALPSGEYTTIPASELTDNHAYRYYRYTNPTEMTNIAEFALEGAFSDDIPEGDPTITDIEEFTDNFEGTENIFGAAAGTLTEDGNQIYASGLDRYGNVFVPVKATASAALAEPVALTDKDMFRMTFTMFAGWENKGRDNTFAIKDKDGNEIAALYMTGGGYNFNQIRIGGSNVLSGTPVSQSRSNPGTTKAGANGWNASGQPYVNTVGYNKTVEITIDGAGNVTISATGGLEDTTVSGTLTAPVSIGSIELTGSYNSARERVVSYDNLDVDIITYSSSFEPDEPEEPTTPPVLPESGNLISLDFDNSDLTSGSTYGKAEGTPEFVTEDGEACVQFDGTSATQITLTDANGNSLLTGLDELTVSFKYKPVATTTSWMFYAAPDNNTQTNNQEKYIGALVKDNGIQVERYNNSGSRPASATGALNSNEWNDVIIIMSEGDVSLYINGEFVSQVDSSVDISDMLGANSVAYIGRANWGTGEYATVYMDDFVIYDHSLLSDLTPDADLTNVTSDLTLPSEVSGNAVTWTSSDEQVITSNGKVTRGAETVTVTLTAKVTVNGTELTRNFDVTVLGLAAAVDSFTAYAENGTVYYTGAYPEGTPYDTYVAIHDANDKLLGVSMNTDSGSFTSIPDGEYEVSCYIWDDQNPQVNAITKKITVEPQIETTAYLFAHFMNTEGDADDEQIYFSVSEDGQNWTTLNGGAPVLTSNVGEKGVRDPYILRGEDGKYFIIATDLSIYNRKQTQGSNAWGLSQTDGSQSIVVWESSDLVNWSKASLVKVAVDNAGCTWAPEAVYDPEKGMYMVFWASKVSDDDYSKQCVYRSYTADFKTFTPAEVYIEDDVSNIDTTIIEHEGIYYRFTKNESRSSIIMEKSNFLDGNWTPVETYNLGDMTGYEGPAIYKINGEDSWCLLLDYYSRSQGYKPFVTDDLAEGIFTQAADFSFDGTYRHGTVMPITEAEYNALVEQYGA